MKRWILLLVVPFTVVRSSTTPTYNTLYYHDKKVSSCDFVAPMLLQICNTFTESEMHTGNVGYQEGLEDGRRQERRRRVEVSK